MDHRLLVVEPEFGRVLGVMKRESNTLSATIRDAFDSGDLSVLTRAQPLHAHDAHISLISHITERELRKLLAEVEFANGFVNRWLITCVTRSKLLPNGGASPAELAGIAARLRALLPKIRKFGLLRRDEAADERWAELYLRMAEDDEGDLASAATARAEAHVLRLSLIYALLGGSNIIRRDHVDAGWAVWCYCRDSARWLFGDSLGDPVADRILRALLDSGPCGMDGTELRDLFNRHKTVKRIRLAVDHLASLELVETESEPTGGHPRFVVRARAVLPGGDRSDASDRNANGRIDRIDRTTTHSWPELGADALHGIAGEVVAAFEPVTESDPAGLLVDFLVSFGNVVGAGPHAIADGAKHPARLFALLVGDTSKARKGTTRANVASLMTLVDRDWAKDRTVSGLSSGEGLIAAVSDPPSVAEKQGGRT